VTYSKLLSQKLSREIEKKTRKHNDDYYGNYGCDRWKHEGVKPKDSRKKFGIDINNAVFPAAIMWRLLR